MKTYHAIFTTIQTKKRANSKKWETDTKLSRVDFTSVPLESLIDPIATPKLRELNKLIINIPENISSAEVQKRWSLVDMFLTPIFFTNSNRLACEWEKLKEATEKKYQNNGQGYADVMLAPLSRN